MSWESTQRVHVGSSAKSRLISVHENTGHARPNTAKDLPGNSPRAFGPLVGRDLLVTLASEQDYFVTGLDDVVTAVDDQHVHRDRPRQGVARGVDQDFGARVEQPSGIAVGVTNGDRGDRGGALQGSAPQVTRALPDLGATNRDDVGAKREGGHESLAGLFERRRQPRGGHVAV